MGTTIDGTSSTATNYKIEEPKTDGPPVPAEGNQKSSAQKAADAFDVLASCTPNMLPMEAKALAKAFEMKANGASLFEAAKGAGKQYIEEKVAAGGTLLLDVFGGPAGEILGIAADTVGKSKGCYDAEKKAASDEPTPEPMSIPDRTTEWADGVVSVKNVLDAAAAAAKPAKP